MVEKVGNSRRVESGVQMKIYKRRMFSAKKLMFPKTAARARIPRRAKSLLPWFSYQQPDRLAVDNSTGTR